VAFADLDIWGGRYRLLLSGSWRCARRLRHAGFSGNWVPPQRIGNEDYIVRRGGGGGADVERGGEEKGRNGTRWVISGFGFRKYEQLRFVEGLRIMGIMGGSGIFGNVYVSGVCVPLENYRIPLLCAPKSDVRRKDVRNNFL